MAAAARVASTGAVTGPGVGVGEDAFGESPPSMEPTKTAREMRCVCVSWM